MLPARISLAASAFVGWLLIVPSVHAAGQPATVMKKHKSIGAYIQQPNTKDRNLAMDRLQNVGSQREKSWHVMRNAGKATNESKKKIIKNVR